MKSPKVIGRGEFGDEDERSATALLRDVNIPFQGGAVGSINVSIYQSTGSEDRGGVVLSITLKDEGSSFFPTAVKMPDGIEIHMAGEIEAKSLIAALKQALQLL